MADVNFLECRSWFDMMFGRPAANRHVTFRIALNLLYQLPVHNIVETGSARGITTGAGGSSFMFAEFISKHGGHLTTIDIDPEVTQKCKEITAVFSGQITYVTGDSLVELGKINKPIDLLYLDSAMIPDRGDATEGQEHTLNEFLTVENWLHKGSVVLIDDNDMENGGKTARIKPYLAQSGWTLILNYHQSVWQNQL